MKRTLFLTLVLLFSMIGFVGCEGNGETDQTNADDPAKSNKKKGIPSDETAQAAQIDYSFIVMGCNRIGWGDDTKKPDKSHETVWRNSKYFNAAHTNLNQLNATWEDVMNLPQKPDYFFFVGDMVLAENKDPNVLQSQLTAWVELYDNHAIANSGIKMVAIPGNHEFLYSLHPEPGELPLEEANGIWLKTMSKFIIGNNGPGVGGPDNLPKDESQLTYSVDHKKDHFVIMNTDTYDEVGSTPVKWIAKDMRDWRKNNPTGHLFLLGHKPAYTEGGWSDLAQEDADTLWKVMKETKAEAMLSAHEHLFWAGQPVKGQSSWQIIAGNGGTNLEKSWKPIIKKGQPADDALPFFGFTEVQVMTDGTVNAISHGRVAPTPDYGPLVGTTTARDTFDLTWQ